VSWLAGLTAPGRTKLGLPPLVAAPGVKELPEVVLETGARYLGTYVKGSLESRVSDHGLRPHSSTRIRLSSEGLDAIRLAGSFRIPAPALRGARHSAQVAGKPVAPHGVLVVRWEHGQQLLDTAFQLSDLNADDTASAPTTKQTEWVRKISKLTKKQEDVA
jgi:hypothetical protein